MSSESGLSSLDKVEKWDVEQLIRYLNKHLSRNLSSQNENILKENDIGGSAILDMSEDRLVSLGFTVGAAIHVSKVIKRLNARLVVVTGSLDDCWTLVQRKVKTEFLDLLEDVDECEIAIKPSSYNQVIKDKDAFEIFLETVPKHKGVRNINFTVETTQINFSKYKKITDLVDIFGASIKDLTTIDDLPQLKFPTKTADMSQLQSIIEAIVTRLKTNLRKRKLNDLDGYDYVYGIVSTGDQWIFTVVSSDNEFGAANKRTKRLSVSDYDVGGDKLKEDVETLVVTIIGITKLQVLWINPSQRDSDLRKFCLLDDR
ncbi:5131_t:CDS:2 [Paraglomus occultum]|uniref:5131_t:CDS:1 n=1 Tax=Paraglomus occultum TaxID=144539 RepID=A0A9N9B0U2_9GLOM|nr:5131_t:CDS:2 [Paraglomus occultum]